MTYVAEESSCGSHTIGRHKNSLYCSPHILCAAKKDNVTDAYVKA